MKKISLGVLTATLLLLSACGKQDIIYDSNLSSEISYECDRGLQEIIVDGNMVYAYREEGSGVEFTYPDGAVCTVYGDDTHIAVSGNAPDSKYVTPETLFEIYRTSNPEFPSAGMILVIIGVLMIAFPKLFWYLDYGWAVNAKESRIALPLIRGTGILILIIGIGMFVF